jgi:hypothetical protein
MMSIPLEPVGSTLLSWLILLLEPGKASITLVHVLPRRSQTGANSFVIKEIARFGQITQVTSHPAESHIDEAAKPL